MDWVKHKIHDYGITDYPQKLEQMLSSLPQIVAGEIFTREISRFIPIDMAERTLQRSTFSTFLAAEIQDLLRQVQDALGQVTDKNLF